MLLAVLCASCSFWTDPEERADYVVTYLGQATALDPVAERTVERAASFAERQPSLKLVVAGFADDDGAPEANQIQSRVRAQRVADALVRAGVKRDRVTIAPRRALGGDVAYESRRVEIRLDR